MNQSEKGDQAPDSTPDGPQQPDQDDPQRDTERRRPDGERAEQPTSDTVVVVTPEGVGLSAAPQGRPHPATQVEEPAKVMRIASMVKQLLDEVRAAPLDEAARQRMAEIHRRSLDELESGLAPELVEELERMALPFSQDAPSDAELRIAQAQLVGWLEGLFHGIQTAIVAQQMAAQSQLQQLRRALPGPQQPPERPQPDRGTGQYL